MIRSYNVFASRIYRLVMLLLYPLAVCICSAVFMVKWGGKYEPGEYTMVFLPMFLIVCFMPSVEIVADYFFLGGINSKKARTMEMLKGSVRGDKIILNAVKADVIRRAAAAVFGQLFTILFCEIYFNVSVSAETFWFGLLYASYIFILETVGILITRRSNGYASVFVCAYGASTFSALTLFIFENLAEAGIAYTVQALVFFAIAAVLAYITVLITRKRRESSYYDVSVKEGEI